jgi:hypothetical protein
MPYLKSSVQDLGLPAFINRMIPIVEWNLSTETSNFSGEERTTGTINPGAIYVADKFQLAVEAIIQVNRASGDNVGVMGQLHLYLDDIFSSFNRQAAVRTNLGRGRSRVLICATSNSHCFC